MPTAVVVGAGLTGAVAANQLARAGWYVEVYESELAVGGQLRSASMNGVLYEPHGPHIFHTDNKAAYAVVKMHAQLNSYVHKVQTFIPPGRRISWPPQVDELRALKDWPKIAAELDSRPNVPSSANFESYVVDLMGPTLYEWLCEGYTRKQWGMEPKDLSARFAPKRLDLRTDGDKRLFKDKWQGWVMGGWQTLVESLLKDIPVFLGRQLHSANLPNADGYVITAPLDDFLRVHSLPWRGIRVEPTWIPDVSSYALPAAVLNYPSEDVLFTREVETKQMALQRYEFGTVICAEYPGWPARHYPVDDADGANRRRWKSLADQLARELPRSVIAGRLATYSYIDTDQAIMQGLLAARKLRRLCGQTG